jgi:hypothetical protein
MLRQAQHDNYYSCVSTRDASLALCMSVLS